MLISIAQKYYLENNLQPFYPGLKDLDFGIFPILLITSCLKFERNAVSKNINEQNCIMSTEEFHIFNDFYVIFQHCQCCGNMCPDNQTIIVDFIFLFIEIL